MRLHFLGTGASGGTPGAGRSRRRESSLLVAAGPRVLIDIGRDFERQQREIDGPIDAVLLTHGHRDASGGLAALGRWLDGRSQDRQGRVPLYASEPTLARVGRRFRRLERHCEPIPVREHRPRRIGSLTLTALVVPHAREPHIPTFAWRLTARGRTLLYASDLARLTPELRRFARGAAALVIDAAMWRRTLFSHLTIDRELPRLCEWRVERILLTQIGRTLPPHPELRREARLLCRRAEPAHDGLTLEL